MIILEPMGLRVDIIYTKIFLRSRGMRLNEIDKIHHVAIIVSNYEVSRDFYVNKLGF